jgi:hypothetical protein
MDCGLNFVENPRNLKTTPNAIGDPYKNPHKAEQSSAGFRVASRATKGRPAERWAGPCCGRNGLLGLPEARVAVAV